MKQYHDLLEDVLKNGSLQATRTGVDALTIPGAMVKFDLEEGFPAVTTKKLYFNAVKGELLGFIRGYNNAADFRKLGCNVWDANANDPGTEAAPNAWLSNPNRRGHDDLGRIYGQQWTFWRAGVSLHRRDQVPPNASNLAGLFIDESNSGVVAVSNTINQLRNALHTIETDPTSRRILVSAWRPDELNQMALPPCHVLFQFLVNVECRELSLCWYQRSVDVFLGLPFNIASYALLLEAVASVTGYAARHLTGFLADTHIYEDHVGAVETQLSRTPYSLPKLKVSTRSVAELGCSAAYDRLVSLEPDNLQLMGYECHPPIPAKMHV